MDGELTLKRLFQRSVPRGRQHGERNDDQRRRHQFQQQEQPNGVAEPGGPDRVPDGQRGHDALGPAARLVEVGVGSQILRDLGVTEMILLTNSPAPVYVGLEGHGLRIVGQRRIE